MNIHISYISTDVIIYPLYILIIYVNKVSAHWHFMDIKYEHRAVRLLGFITVIR